MNVKFIIIHCTATPAGRDITAADVDRWHKARGFSQIGYHYLIRLDGTIEKGRPETMAGAHTLGQNGSSIGVCYVGGLDRQGKTACDTRTPAQRVALDNLLRDLLTRYPGATVRGHRDFAAKACPSFDATAEYHNFRSVVLALLMVMAVSLMSCRSSTSTMVTASDSVMAEKAFSASMLSEMKVFSHDSLCFQLEQPRVEIHRPDSVIVTITASSASARRSIVHEAVHRDTFIVRDTIKVSQVRDYHSSSGNDRRSPGFIPYLIVIGFTILIFTKLPTSKN